MALNKVVTAIMLVAGGYAAAGQPYFAITVVDEQTGRGVPLVRLETVNNIRYYTDSNGIVAFHEPGLMGQPVFFHVKSHGYEYPADGFEYRGVRLTPTPGGSAKIAMRRLNIAQRLYRVTGAGIYRDSFLVGGNAPTRRPLLNGLVLGSDSVVNAVYRGRIYWFWGDTNRSAYPLGNFHVPGATSRLPSDGGLDPEVGVDLEYFEGEGGFAKETARMPGEGPTWIGGLVTVTGPDGSPQMLASYVKIRNFLDAYERGIVRFDDETKQFEKVGQLELDAPAYPRGHPFKHTVDGVEYVYFADPYPLTRVPADPLSLMRPSRYECFTCLAPGSRVDDKRLDRGDDGALNYGWKPATPAVGPAEQARLVQAGLMRPEEGLLQLRDRDTGQAVNAHGGSVYYSEYLQRWAMIAVQSGGSSFLGEVWFAQADTPLGPWVYARKIVTHDQYSFYNPKQHPMLDKDGGRTIFFEGTYTHTFSGNSEQTPRYDYNQIMYKLDLSDPRLALPVAVYGWADASGAQHLGVAHDAPPAQLGRPAAFMAPARPAPGCVPVYAAKGLGAGSALSLERSAEASTDEPVFYAVPPDAQDPPAATTPLYEYIAPDGARHMYGIEDKSPAAGYRRSDGPVCLVWPGLVRVALPAQ